MVWVLVHDIVVMSHVTHRNRTRTGADEHALSLLEFQLPVFPNELVDEYRLLHVLLIGLLLEVRVVVRHDHQIMQHALSIVYVVQLGADGFLHFILPSVQLFDSLILLGNSL